MNNDYTRDEVIDLTLKQVDAWRKLPKEKLYEVPPYASNRELKYPQTEVETALIDLLHIYLTEEWIQPHTEPLLDEIESDLIRLDTGLDRPKTWAHLFELIDELRETERPQSK